MSPFTSIDQIKAGMRVRCVYSIISERFGKTATVVSVITRGASTGTGHQIRVDWDDADTAFPTWSYFISFVPVDLLSTSEDVEYFSKQIRQALTPNVRQEKPCQVCGRNNDLGIGTC